MRDLDILVVRGILPLVVRDRLAFTGRRSNSDSNEHRDGLTLVGRRGILRSVGNDGLAFTGRPLTW